MGQSLRKWALFVLRWTIAAAGIIWVVAQLSWRDHVTILDQSSRPVQAAVVGSAAEDASTFTILDPYTGKQSTVDRSQLVNPVEKPRTLEVRLPGELRNVQLLALDLGADLRTVQRLLIENRQTLQGQWIDPGQVVGGFKLQIPRPRVQVGLGTLVAQADALLLWGSVAIFPITFILTSIRWYMLLKGLGIFLTRGRTFVLNMVGAFYSTFMPGVTGGDVLKAYYASKQTLLRTHAVVSVLVDRAIGLMALVLLGGAMATWQLLTGSPEDPAMAVYGQVAIGAAVVLAGACFCLAVLGQSTVRRSLGLDWILRRLPMQRQVQRVIEAMRIYRNRPGLILVTLLITFPVHITVILSALMAGKAFDLPLSTYFYFVAVPVIVLAGSMPLTPQGAGVMEFFAVALTQRHGATVSQAFLLAMAIRLVQILWNLTGGIFVFRGGYHVPTTQEQNEMEEPDPTENTAQPA